MSDPRVLITAHPSAFFNRGGGEVELIDLASNLRKLGIQSDMYGPDSLPLSKYDTVLHYSVVPTGMQVLKEAKDAGKKIILLPSLWWHTEPTTDEKNSVVEFSHLADKLVFKSKSEYDNIAQYVDLDPDKISYCRWGVDPSFEEPVKENIFRNAYKLDDYLLWVGIIEERKNQITAIHALKETKYPVVFIGDYRDRLYYEACVKLAPSYFKFLPYMQEKSEMLRSAIQGCRVFIELSLEPPGLSAFEAGLAKVPMVLSAGPWTDEHFGSLVRQADPRSPDAIKKAVEESLSAQVDPELYRRVHNRHLLPQSLEPLVRLLQMRL